MGDLNFTNGCQGLRSSYTKIVMGGFFKLLCFALKY